MSGRILIVESIATNRILLRAALEKAHYTVACCGGAASARRLLVDFSPDLVILDMAPAGDAAAGFIADLARTGHPVPVPVIATITTADGTARLSALTAGALDVVCKPPSEGLLLARVRSLLRTRDTMAELRPIPLSAGMAGFAEPAQSFAAPARVVVLSPRPDRLSPALARLVAQAPSRYEVHDLATDIAAPPDGPAADLFIVDAASDATTAVLPGWVFRLQAELRSRSGTRHAAQLLILPPNAADLAAMALDLGADDLVTDRVDGPELRHRIDVLLRQKTRCDGLRANVQSGLEAAVTDPLTGLHNRRYALPHLAALAEESGRTGRGFAAMILDIDHFKAINDTFGHSVGDTILVGVASRLRDALRPRDMIARIGGEEFLIAMPDTTLELARQTAERLRRTVGERSFDGNAPTAAATCARKARIGVTLSVGVAMGRADCRSEAGLGALFERADAALYAAKTAGRNMVTLGDTAA